MQRVSGKEALASQDLRGHSYSLDTLAEIAIVSDWPDDWMERLAAGLETLADARARLVAWEPIVKAAVDLRRAAYGGGISPDAERDHIVASAKIIAAVDALPQEMKP